MAARAPSDGDDRDAPLAERFAPLMARVAQCARPGETSAGWFAGERSDFVRFNRGRVRQAGSVERHTLDLRLMRADRQAHESIVLVGRLDTDAARVDAAFARLRDTIAHAEPDPYLSFDDTGGASRSVRAAGAPNPDEIADTVCVAADDSDLVGFWSAGPIARGFASSRGHSHWHESGRWSFDWSIHVHAAGRAAGGFPGEGGRALKATLTGESWSAPALSAAIARSVRDAAVLARPARRLEPGHYRAWLAPRALADLVGMLGWGGFSERAHRSGQSPLARLRAGESAFDARVQFAERLGDAGVPLFQADGFARPPELALVRDGRHAGSLVSPRSAREFGVAANGAADAEAPEALAMAPGGLDETRALAELGEGVAVSNLWYLNFSDRRACRVTGLTRFATMWVEGGEAVAPVEVMRFDDSLYRLLGSELLALGDVAHRIPDTDTYDARALGSTCVPGALVGALAFTL